MNSSGSFRLIRQPLLSERTSIRIGGPALAELRIRGLQALEKAAHALEGLGGRPVLLGRGSNVLAADGELPLVLLSLECDSESQLVGEEQNRVLVRAQGGQKLSGFLNEAAGRGLGGLEGLAGIPGSVGGAVAMNAGSFGVEIGALVRTVEIFSPMTGHLTLAASDIDFSYRSCSFKIFAGAQQSVETGNWFAITAATFALAKTDADKAQRTIREVLRKKRASQPLEAWSAGSTFKNPTPEAPAGLLLEQAGMRGLGLGGVYFSEKHANFLVNTGEGSFAQAMELVTLARERVKSMSGHELELEVRLWP